MVFAMAVIGAITRLTESGLSMVEWRPLIGALPPLTEAEWQRVFDLYRATPEYRLKNAGMDLAGFQTIFFWEWFHRLWGRLIGVIFALPLVWFWWRGMLSAWLKPRLLMLLAFGGMQGGIGAWMVASGLVDVPTVSHYRLATHLGLALVIFSLILWTWAECRPRPPAVVGAAAAIPHASLALGLLAVTITWGAFVAGLDAGMVYNSWPDMNGAVLPPEAWAAAPAWLNVIDNQAMVQFLHRSLAYLTAVVVMVLCWQLWRLGMVWYAAAGLCALSIQLGLGIGAVVLAVPVWLGGAHQAGAITLLAVLVLTRHRLATVCRPSIAVAATRSAGLPDTSHPTVA
jgi:cytochrome c oxidase assembly protein subunit 15